MITTNKIAIKSVSFTSVMALRTKVVLSKPTSIVISAGSSLRSWSIRLYISSAMATWLEPGCAMAARETTSILFFLDALSSSAGPKVA